MQFRSLKCVWDTDVGEIAASETCWVFVSRSLACGPGRLRANYVSGGVTSMKNFSFDGCKGTKNRGGFGVLWKRLAAVPRKHFSSAPAIGTGALSTV